MPLRTRMSQMTMVFLMAVCFVCSSPPSISPHVSMLSNCFMMLSCSLIVLGMV